MLDRSLLKNYTGGELPHMAQHWPFGHKPCDLLHSTLPRIETPNSCYIESSQRLTLLSVFFFNGGQSLNTTVARSWHPKNVVPGRAWLRRRRPMEVLILR